MITIEQEGDFSKLDSYFEQLKGAFNNSSLDKYGRAGVAALALATPYDTGKTAQSWSYEVQRGKNTLSLIFKNSNLTENGTPVAILIQYGHATRDGGFVEGIDYINPALRPLMQQIADDLWEEVTK